MITNTGVKIIINNWYLAIDNPYMRNYRLVKITHIGRRKKGFGFKVMDNHPKWEGMKLNSKDKSIIYAPELIQILFGETK